MTAPGILLVCFTSWLTPAAAPCMPAGLPACCPPSPCTLNPSVVLGLVSPKNHRFCAAMLAIKHPSAARPTPPGPAESMSLSHAVSVVLSRMFELRQQSSGFSLPQGISDLAAGYQDSGVER